MLIHAVFNGRNSFYYQPAKVCRIVRARGVLHNVAQRNGIPLPPDLPPPELDPEAEPPPRQEGFQQSARLRADVMRRL